MPVYLVLNIVTLLFPLALSFDKRVGFFRRWGALLPAIVITATVFLIWDYFFTAAGIWSFNSEHLIGTSFFGMPVEEWLFFLTVPYACVFIYECLRAYVKIDFHEGLVYTFLYVLAFGLILMGFVFREQAYTMVNFTLAGLFTLVVLRNSNKQLLGYFLFTYLVHLIPFIVINGVLTYLPVVSYNDRENLAIRALTIPVEDFIYSYLLLLMNIFFYEQFLPLWRQRAQ